LGRRCTAYERSDCCRSALKTQGAGICADNWTHTVLYGITSFQCDYGVLRRALLLALGPGLDSSHCGRQYKAGGVDGAAQLELRECCTCLLDTEVKPHDGGDAAGRLMVTSQANHWRCRLLQPAADNASGQQQVLLAPTQHGKMHD
jgi:hypothetical protein